MLVQSDLKMGSALAEKVGGSTALADHAWRLLQLALADRAWRLLQLAIESRRAGLVSTGWSTLLLSCTNGRRKRSLHLVGTPFLAY